MFRKIASLFGAGAPASPAAPADDRLSVAALLVEAARADDDFDDAERAMIDRILAEDYGLGAEDAAKLRLEGEAAQANAADTVRFTRAVKAARDADGQFELMIRLWEVVFADGVRDASEDAVARKLVGLLAVNDRQSADARNRAIARGRT